MNSASLRSATFQVKEVQMLKENQSELFTRLLIEALEADRMIRKLGFSTRSKANTERYNKLFLSDLDYDVDSMEPIDCFQLISEKTEKRRVG